MTDTRPTPAGGRPEEHLVAVLRDVATFLSTPERTLDGRRDTEHSYRDEPLKVIRERIDTALEAYDRQGT